MFIFQWASLVAQLVKNPSAMQETWVQSLGWEDPLKKGTATHSSILAWKIPWITVHGVTKSQIWLNNVHFHMQNSRQEPYCFCLVNVYSSQGSTFNATAGDHSKIRLDSLFRENDSLDNTYSGFAASVTDIRASFHAQCTLHCYKDLGVYIWQPREIVNVWEIRIQHGE